MYVMLLLEYAPRGVTQGVHSGRGQLWSMEISWRSETTGLVKRPIDLYRSRQNESLSPHDGKKDQNPRGLHCDHRGCGWPSSAGSSFYLDSSKCCAEVELLNAIRQICYKQGRPLLDEPYSSTVSPVGGPSMPKLVHSLLLRITKKPK